MTVTAVKALLLVIAVLGVSLSLLVLRRQRKEILLALIVLLLSLMGVEISLRYVFPLVAEHDAMFIPDSELGWTFAPNRRGAIVSGSEARLFIVTNAHGFRDDPIPPLDADTIRIMVLGDSFVTNVSVEDEDVFTEVMERELRGASVMNFGVNGYGQVQQYLVLEKWWDQVKPDRVIVVVYIRNDFQDNVFGHWLYPGPVAVWNEEDATLKIVPPPPAPVSSPAPVSWSWYQDSQFFTLFDRGLRAVMDRSPTVRKDQHEPSAVTPPELYLCRKEISEETRTLYRTMEALLLEISGRLEEQGVPYLFVLAPSRVQVDDAVWNGMLEEYAEDGKNYQASLPNDRLMRFAGDHGLPMLDLLPPLHAEVQKGRTLYFPEEEHWTSEGNRVVAELLLKSPLLEDLR
jgi:hypothetical protein